MLKEVTQQLTENRWIMAAILFASVVTGMAIAGAIGAFSPVPYWDMWGGTLGFYIAQADGHPGIWWSQHNEHRIVLSRILFWLDYELFDGIGLFLIVMNYVIIALAVLTFYFFARQYLAADSALTARQYNTHTTSLIFTALITAWLYQWMQEENLIWAFQSQFFLAQLLPLIALYLLGRATGNDRASNIHFAAACLTGVACAGTMANGIIALPLLTVYALVTRHSLRRILVLASVSALVLFSYFNNYVSPGYHGSLSQALLEQPVQLAHYVLLYLGSPFFVLVGKGSVGLTIAPIATGIMALMTIAALLHTLKNARQNALALALIFYIIYLAGTALGTGGGRLTFGVYQAVSERYTTPALMAWAALFLLYLPIILSLKTFYRNTAGVLVLIVLLLIVWRQTAALAPRDQMVFERAVAGLALELVVHDTEQISNIYVMSEGLLRTAEVASQQNLSIFGTYPWQDLKERMGQVVSIDSLPACLGNLDIVGEVDDSNYMALEGWLYSAEHRSPPPLIAVTNAAGEIAGFALTGKPRPDVRDAVAEQAYLSGFRGYVQRDTMGEPATLVADRLNCRLTIDIPVIGGVAE